jgi:hypothetical protein
MHPQPWTLLFANSTRPFICNCLPGDLFDALQSRPKGPTNPLPASFLPTQNQTRRIPRDAGTSEETFAKVNHR